MNLEKLYEKLNTIYSAMNELTVTGTRNCSIVGAVASAMEQIAKELHDEIEKEQAMPKKKEEK